MSSGSPTGIAINLHNCITLTIAILSHAQYELQFNKWGERKNLSADEWRRVLQKVDQYNELGIECSVYLSQQLVPPSTLKKKRGKLLSKQEIRMRNQQRRKHKKYFTLALVALKREASIALLPDCVEIRTIPPDHEFSEMQGVDEFGAVFESVSSDQAVAMDEPMPVPTSSNGCEAVLGVDNLQPGVQDLRSTQSSQECDLSIRPFTPSTSQEQGSLPVFLDPNFGFPSPMPTVGVESFGPTNEQLPFPSFPSETPRATTFPSSQHCEAFVGEQVQCPLMRNSTSPSILYDLGSIDGLNTEVFFPSFDQEMGSSGRSIPLQPLYFCSSKNVLVCRKYKQWFHASYSRAHDFMLIYLEPAY